jgi:7,8-dihydropterin-6-yl-methyl-4-(beta-D-ribofuranosyl)aminobenzene 5'-phosphate synthase
MKITILYDNNAKPGLKPGWGFSCLVENDRKILFDTGDNGEKLIWNFGKLSIEPRSVDIVVLSHNHWDHVDGLESFRRLNSEAQVIYPETFLHPTELTADIYSTGALGTGIREQALVARTQKGNVVVTGCAHPGLEKIIQTAKQLGEIYAVLGGFHGFSRLNELDGIKLIAPCHCTQYIEEIKQKYPTQFKEIKAGSVIAI